MVRIFSRARFICQNSTFIELESIGISVYGYYDRFNLKSFKHMDWEPAINSEEVRKFYSHLWGIETTFLFYSSYEWVVIIKHVSISILPKVVPRPVDASIITMKVVCTIDYLLDGKFLKFACLNLSCGFDWLNSQTSIEATWFMPCNILDYSFGSPVDGCWWCWVRSIDNDLLLIWSLFVTSNIQTSRQ